MAGEIRVDIYCDPVQYCRNGKQKLLCQVVRFITPDRDYDCRQKFNACTITWSAGYQMEKTQRLAAIAYELRKAKLEVRLVLADMIERQYLCNKTSHLSEFGCDQCVCKTDAGHYTVAETFGEPMRDEVSWKRVVEDRKTFLGRKGPAALHELPGFVITEGLPPDPMHQIFLGHVHFLIKKFVLSDKCHQGKNVKESLLRDINANYNNIRTPKEIQRTPRDYDKTWCANEFKVLLLCCGHKIADIFEAHELKQLAMLWARFTYFIRALLLPDQWLIGVEQVVPLETLIEDHLRDLESLLGRECMTANTHALSHMLHWRRRYRLHLLSCEPGEAFYGQNKRCLEVRNKHYGRQVHYNRNTEYLRGHECRNAFSYTNPRTNSAKDNAIIVDRFMKVYRYVVLVVD